MFLFNKVAIAGTVFTQPELKVAGGNADNSRPSNVKVMNTSNYISSFI
jgi:hypothetical protein